LFPTECRVMQREIVSHARLGWAPSTFPCTRPVQSLGHFDLALKLGVICASGVSIRVRRNAWVILRCDRLDHGHAFVLQIDSSDVLAFAVPEIATV
jgi:hypothetical protein